MVKADESGRLVVDVDALKYENGKAGKVPEGYYSVFVAPQDEAASEFGIYQFNATSGSNSGNTTPDAPSPTPAPNNTPGTDSGGGGGGGCNAGIFCAAALVLVFLTRKH